MNINKLSISFVIPLYRSENTIGQVIHDIDKLKNVNWEAVLVNDNSPDNVHQKVLDLIKEFPKNIIYLQHRKNSGQQTAILNGMKYVTKDLVATIDDDGQNPPEEILNLEKVMKEGDFDLVFGAIKEKKHSPFRRFVSKLNRNLSVYTLGNKNRIPISNIRLMKRDIANSMAQTSSSHNYIEGLAFSLTDHIGYSYVEHRERISGKSGYNLFKLIKLWSNHIIGYSNIVIKAISIFSFIIAFSAFLIGVGYFLLTINNPDRPTGWLSTYLTMTFLFSVVFVILGIIAEYLGRIYIKINQNKSQIINKVYIHE